MTTLQEENETLRTAVEARNAQRDAHRELPSNLPHAIAPSTPLTGQVAGDHYKNKAIQPVQYIHANGLGYMEGAVVKYVTRHREKGGSEDLRKAIHYLELLLHLEYGEKSDW